MITLTEGKLQHEWGDLYEECQAEVEGFYRALEEHLRRLRPPDTKWERESASPSTMKGLTGKRREGLLVRNNKFREHLIYVMAREYGATLNISYYQTGSTRAVILGLLDKIPVLNRALNLIGLLRDMDVFDRQDFHAWAAVVRSAVNYAVKQITEKHNLEAKIDWKSKGMFGVS